MPKSKYTEEFVRDFLNELGCELLSSYTGVKKEFEYLCICGEKAKSNFDKFKNGGQKGCSKCKGIRSNKHNRLKFEEVKTYFEKQECILLETEYIDSKTKMSYLCICGEEDQKTWNHFRKGQRCKKCAVKTTSEKQKIKIENVTDFFMQHGCTLLSTNYINMHSDLNYICTCGEKVTKPFATFKSSPKCNCKLQYTSPLKRKYTKDELIEYFWKYYNEYGKYPAISDLKTNKNYPSPNSYARQWGTWNEFLNQIGILGEDEWYLRDEQILKEMYGLFPKELIIDSLMVKRKWGTIKAKANKLGLKYSQYEDIDLINLLIDFYQTHKKKPTVSEFDMDKNTPSASIYKNRFGSWNNALRLAGFEVKDIVKLTDDEINTIINDYKNNIELTTIANKFDINTSRILTELKKKKIPTRTNRWTEVQINRLYELYPHSSWDILINEFSPFRKEDILTKASSLGIDRECYGYSEEQENFLIKNYEKYPIKQLSDMLGKTEGSITSKANKLGLKRVEKWSNEEIGILEEHYATTRINDLITLLPSRNRNTIIEKANHLGLRKEKEVVRSNNVKKIRKKLLSNLNELATKLGRTPTSIEVNELLSSGASAYHRYFGSYSNACKEAGLEVNVSLFGKSRHIESKNGDVCLSQKEKEITDLLIDNEIIYEKEVLYKDIIENYNLKNIRCDWLLNNDIIVEYFGMPEKEGYKERMNEKITLCKIYGIKFIDLYENDVNCNFKGLVSKFKKFDINISSD